MRRLHLSTVVLVGTAAVTVASCQLVAGVQTDGELRSTDASSSSAGGGGGGTTSSSDSSSSVSSSSGYTGPLCNNYPCDGACVELKCYHPTCNASPPAEVFDASELLGHTLSATPYSAVSNSKAVVAIIDETTNQLRVRSVSETLTTSPIVDFTLGANVSLSGTRFGGLFVAYQGIMDDELVEIRVQNLLGQDPEPPTLYSLGKPKECGPAEKLERARFNTDSSMSSYVANCGDGGTSYKLVAGAVEGSTELLGAATAPSPELRLDAFAAVGPTRLVLTGSGKDGEQTYYRSGMTASELAIAKPYRFTSGSTTNPSTLFLSQLAGDPSSLAYYGVDVAANGTGALWTGIVTDLASLSASVPPSGFELASETLDSVQLDAKVGVPDLAVSASQGVFLPMRTLTGSTVSIAWFSALGQKLLLDAPMYTTDAGAIRGITLAPLGLQGKIAIVWIERILEVDHVKASIFTCDLGPADPPPNGM